MSKEIDSLRAQVRKLERTIDVTRRDALEEAAMECVSLEDYLWNFGHPSARNAVAGLASRIRALKKAAPQMARAGEGSLTTRDASVGEQSPAVADPYVVGNNYITRWCLKLNTTCNGIKGTCTCGKCATAKPAVWRDGAWRSA